MCISLDFQFLCLFSFREICVKQKNICFLVRNPPAKRIPEIKLAGSSVASASNAAERSTVHEFTMGNKVFKRFAEVPP